MARGKPGPAGTGHGGKHKPNPASLPFDDSVDDLLAQNVRLGVKELQQLGHGCPSTILKRIREGRFPPPIATRPRRWSAAQIIAHNDAIRTRRLNGEAAR